MLKKILSRKAKIKSLTIEQIEELSGHLSEIVKNQKENFITIMKRYISKEFKNLNIQVLSIAIS